MQLYIVPVGPLETNCFIIVSGSISDGTTGDKREAIIIDPGDEADIILNKIFENNLDVKYLVITHAHWDHIGAVTEVAKKTGAKIAVHSLDVPILNEPDMNLHNYLIANDSLQHIDVDLILEDGATIPFGDLEARILHTPGHSKGSVSVLIEDSLFTGDLIFYRSIARTDFEGGSLSDLKKSVTDIIFKFPDSVKIYPGHGQGTTVGDERRNNPYFIGY